MISVSAEREADWVVTTAGVRVRDDLALIDVSGEDHRTWLNGQISNDVRSTKTGDAVYALVLNVRGKVLSDLWALDRGERFALVVPRKQREEITRHFEQYIIMEDVVLSADDDVAIVSVQGPRSAQVVAGVSAPGFPCDELGTGGHYVLTTPSDVTRVAADLSRAASELGGGPINETIYERVRVRLGVPRFDHDFDNTCYPQEAGLKARAVSFSKGCYLGQEVVCTLENRGKLNRKLVSMQLDGNATAGEAIVVGDEPSGKVTSVAGDGAQSYALGYVRRIHLDAAAELKTAGGKRLSIARVVGQE